VVTTLAAPATLPLPSGAATSAKQDTGNSSLSSIDGKLHVAGLTNTPVSENTTGAKTIITPTAGKALRIVRVNLSNDAPNALTFSIGSTPLTGAMMLTAMDVQEQPYLWAGAADEVFKITLGSAVQVSGFVLSYEV
jgi:hypothetical protein